MASFDHQAAIAAYQSLRDQSDRIYNALTDDAANTIMVGTATCGIAAGAREILDAFRQAVEEKGIDAKVMEVGCMGHCYAEPMAIVKRPGYPPLVYNRLTPGSTKVLVNKFFLEEDPYFDVFLGAAEVNEMLPSLNDLPRYGMEHRRLLDRCGRHDPEDIHQAIALGAYEGLVKAIQMDPETLIDTIRESGLRGLGGAGFPVWKKWKSCREQKDPEKYIICNADEGDPGAFMDRTILESDPHAVLEGMIIGAIAIRSEKGFVYVRAEYPQAVIKLKAAIKNAHEHGLLGENILKSGLRFDIQVVRGAGAFVCGESSALMYSIEGKRGMPRVRPPQSVESGLYGKPTVLNNVKSYASVGRILTEGPEKFSSIGTESSKGTAVFALAGKTNNPGLVEVPMGTTLRELIFDIGGGIPNGKKFKAVQIGGPSGGCLPESMLDTPIDFDALSEAGSMMGSGGMVILDEDNCMVETARFFLEFTQRESCGKCTFCRIGTRHMLDILTKITEGEADEKDIETLEMLAEEVADGSLCNLGKTAPNPVITTLRFFREEYEAHIKELTCQAKECKALTSYYILPDKCARGCDACVGSCPPEAIWTSPKRRIKIVDQQMCVKCDSCMSACPTEYDAVVKISPIRDVPPSESKPEGGGAH